jgi:2-dehydropantoate 2-reductase
MRIAVLGAGSIGCFVGGMLARGGHRVALIGRERVLADIAAHGLRLTDAEGLNEVIAPERLILSEQPDVLGSAAVILVSVKSDDTLVAAEEIARHGAADAVVVSLQNGIGNAAVLRAWAGGRAVLGGMVPFNVQAMGQGRFHRATTGDIVLARDRVGTADALSVAGLALRATDDIAGVQWGKLIVNLNNALNALSGLPLRAQLADRAWRRLMADQWAEALAVLRSENIRPVSATPVPVSWTPHILRLPDALFAAILGRTMTIDATARSSMADDLARGRRTEIDHLQGVIVERARRHRLPAPISQRVTELVKRAEADGKGLPRLTPEQVRGACVD